MFLVFLYEESYLKFLVNYLETKKLDPNEEDEDSDEEGKVSSREQKSFSIAVQKNTKVTEFDTQKVSKFLHIKQLGKELKERTESISNKKKTQSMKKNKGLSPLNKTNKSPIAKKNSRSSIIIENELKNMIILNSTCDSNNLISANDSPLGKDTPKNIGTPKQINKEDIIKIERTYYVLAEGGLFTGVLYKNEKLMRFCWESSEIQFFSAKNKKFICSYLIQDIEKSNKDSEIQASLVFRNTRKLKSLSLLFPMSEDLNEFLETFELILKRKRKKRGKNNELEIKDFLKKNIRRYSWLTQPLNALIPKKTSAEHAFQIINETFNPAKQVLHMNFIHRILSFLKKNKDKPTILKELNIQKILHLENCPNDIRKMTLKMEKKKVINIIFPSVKQKLVFESAVNNIIVKAPKHFFYILDVFSMKNFFLKTVENCTKKFILPLGMSGSRSLLKI